MLINLNLNLFTQVILRKSRKETDTMSPKVIIEDCGDSRKITVNGTTVFDDKKEEFSFWNLLDTLNALQIEWRHVVLKESL